MTVKLPVQSIHDPWDGVCAAAVGTGSHELLSFFSFPLGIFVVGDMRCGCELSHSLMHFAISKCL